MFQAFTAALRQSLSDANVALDLAAPVVANLVLPGYGGMVVSAGDRAINNLDFTPGQKLALKEPEFALPLLFADFLSSTRSGG